ncbi:MAG: tetratricopeptide repeat protein [Acidobacteria bacterium]|nr:tetratricopeptide repeat protein [Acidobacteriota bacterium]
MRTVRHALPALLAATVAVAAAGLGAACAPGGDTTGPGVEAPSTGAGRADSTSGAPDASPADAPEVDAPPPPVELPDLAELPEPVRVQVRESHDALLRAQAESAPATALAEAYGDLGLVLMATRFYDTAAAALLNAAAEAPGEMQWPYYLAQLYRTTGDQPRARRYFERAVEIDPSYLAALVRLGEMYLDEGRPEEAEPLFERALAIDSSSAAALSGAGSAALARGEPTRAIDYLERALAVGPPAWNVHYTLATAYRETGETAKADEHLNQSGGDPPEPPDPLMTAYENLLRGPRAYGAAGAAAMREGRPAEAVSIFREGVAEAPDDADLRRQLGDALLATGDTRGAGEQYETALRLNPTEARAYVGIAVLLAMSGRHAEAIDRYAAAISHQPDYLEARLGLVDAYRAVGRPGDAAAEAARAVEIAPGFPDAWLGLGLLLTQLERYREARDRLEEAIAVHPDELRLIDLLIRILAAAPDDAARDGQRAMVLAAPLLQAPPNPTIDETVAMALAETGRYTEAAERQRRAITAAEQAGRPDVARNMAAALALYEQGRPMRSPFGRAPQ